MRRSVRVSSSGSGSGSAGRSGTNSGGGGGGSGGSSNASSGSSSSSDHSSSSSSSSSGSSTGSVVAIGSANDTMVSHGQAASPFSEPIYQQHCNCIGAPSPPVMPQPSDSSCSMFTVLSCLLGTQGLKEEAITFYNQAADLFATENATSEANKCKLKVAEFSAELERYDQAVALYEEVGWGRWVLCLWYRGCGIGRYRGWSTGLQLI